MAVEAHGVTESAVCTDEKKAISVERADHLAQRDKPNRSGLCEEGGSLGAPVMPAGGADVRTAAGRLASHASHSAL